ncbi:hypothetical protein [Micromonospora echinospora]|uniref:hypothetical protein n=1 Tax=Micromonospora echinospora TaxID=1877 RepID=UPI003A8C3354
MNRSSTPGQSYPAGHQGVPHGHRARSLDYPSEESSGEVSLDPALATSAGHGGVGVFQAPGRSGGRPTPAAGESAPPRPAPESPDIDSPSWTSSAAPDREPASP